jgi:hypothetical protein
MTPLQQKIGSLQGPPEAKPRSRVNRWLSATGYSLVRWLVTVAYVFIVVGLGSSYISNDIQPFALPAVTAAYAILMLLLWLYERFPSAGR